MSYEVWNSEWDEFELVAERRYRRRVDAAREAQRRNRVYHTGVWYVRRAA